MDANLPSELALVDGAARLAGHTRPRGDMNLARFVVNVITEKMKQSYLLEQKSQLTMVGPVKAVMSGYRDDRSA
jgi:hypothetical protein